MRRIRRQYSHRVAQRDQQLVERIASLDVPPAPADSPPMLPRDVTELSYQDLMILFGEMTGWAAHYAGLLAQAEAREESAESLLEFRRAQAKEAIANRGGKKSATEVKAAAEADEDVQSAKEEYLKARAERRMAQVRYDNSCRFAAFLSRELSRRTATRDQDGRAEKWLP